jgi:hypothetical protein
MFIDSAFNRDYLVLSGNSEIEPAARFRLYRMSISSPIVDAIHKVRDNEPQKQQQNRFHQRSNLDGSFSLSDGILSTHLLLVDDVIDSGWMVTVLAALLRRPAAGLSTRCANFNLYRRIKPRSLSGSSRLWLMGRCRNCQSRCSMSGASRSRCSCKIINYILVIYPSGRARRVQFCSGQN